MLSSDIIRICAEEFPAHESDCSGFVKAVAGRLSVPLHGLANDIVDQIQAGPWEVFDQVDYDLIKASAANGQLIVAGLKGSDQKIPDIHGHVVIVVADPKQRDQWQSGPWPCGYWGRLNQQGCEYRTLNWAWNRRVGDLDKVIYSAYRGRLTEIPFAGRSDNSTVNEVNLPG